MSTLTRDALGTDALLIGNDAGWLLSFHAQKNENGLLSIAKGPAVLEIGCEQYNGQINASLPAGLEGGVYSFVIEGLIEKHYRDLKQVGGGLVVKLFLYWRDAATTVRSDGADIRAEDITASLVAVLSVVSISRRAGTRLYETTITARERVFEILNGRRVCGTAIEAPPEQAVSQLLERARLKEFEYHGARPHPESRFVPAVKGAENDGRQKLKPGQAVQLLREVGARLEEKTGRHGRGMFLIRDGALHIGTRAIPFDDEFFPLHPGNGLIQVESLEPQVIDPNFDACSADTGTSFSEQESPKRRQFKLTLKGRPDIKPGAVVTFDLPEEEREAADNRVTTVQLYVSTVEHRLGRTTGFVTTLSGVEFTNEADQWDGHTPANRDGESAKATSEVNAETSAGKAVQKMVESRIDARRFAEICEVRAATVQGKAEPPSQTVDLMCGLEPSDGGANQARRLAIHRQSGDRASGVPYASPFAWGKCGLVLPRYPGTRLVTVHRQGRSDDAIDMGALWESGHGPDSQAGDWWLILPAGIPAERRRQIAADETPQEHRGSVTQDLIDADGNRVIEVGQLSIVVVAQDKLKKAGERPQHGTHVPGGASIIVKPDGSVVIKAERIEFDAGDGDITMKARNVNVRVSGAMDVS